MNFIDQLARVFAEQGHSLYRVGGCVRDALLGSAVHDHDLTTDAVPEVIKRLVQQAHADSVYTVGEKFGTIGAIFGDDVVEITTYRSETYTPGNRKPEVEFGTILEGDLARRDFTINAMARPAAGGELVDPFGGQRDLAAGIVRAVGNPDERFAEDPLRLLRAVRFAAQFGFRIETETRAAISRCADRLQSISAERIAQELNKILVTPRPSEPIRELCDLGLMRYIAPEFVDLRAPSRTRARHKDVFEHTLMVMDRAPRVLTVRWGAMLHDIAKPRTMTVDDDEVHFYGHEIIGERLARRILSRLKYDRSTVDRVATLVSMSGRINSYEGEWTDGAVRRLARDAGDALEELFLLSRSDVTSKHPERVAAAERRVDNLRERYLVLQEEEDIAKIRPPIDGNDLMELFDRPPGPWIRPIKDHLLELVLDGELGPDDRDSAIAIAQRMLDGELPRP